MIDAEHVMPDASEVIQYNQVQIPLYVRSSRLSDYPGRRALCHWHEDFEFIRIQKGAMNYYINGKNIALAQGDCLMVNSRQLHYGYGTSQNECEFICVLLHPQLFTANTLLHQRYILPVIQNPNAEFIHMKAGGDTAEQISSLLDTIAEIQLQQPTAHELEIIGILNILWSKLLQRYPELFSGAAGPGADHPDLTAQKSMVAYIQQHYAEKLTLSDIAASGNVCASKCCLLFKYYLQQSPIDFLNHYRLKVSCDLLSNTSWKISEIATACGFNHLSYYSKLFVKHYACTPGEYRKKHCLH